MSLGQEENKQKPEWSLNTMAFTRRILFRVSIQPIAVNTGFLQIQHKPPLGLKDEQITLFEVKGRCDLTYHVLGHNGHFPQMNS